MSEKKQLLELDALASEQPLDSFLGMTGPFRWVAMAIGVAALIAAVAFAWPGR